MVEERKSRFMAVVSHELRSPLHGVIGLIAALETSEQVASRKRQLNMVKACATRLLDLVVNIMDMSRFRYDKL
jgi:signal transduction histidine kinase